MGIDIRNGLQIACIHCALCIDACDSIMDKYQWPRGLVRYTSENGLEGKKTKIWKLRTIGYGVATLLGVVALVWSISTTKELEASAQQVRSPLFVLLSDGSIQNSYEFKINNKAQEAASYKLTLEELPNAQLHLGALDASNIKVGADASVRLLVKVVQPEPLAGLAKNREFHFRLEPLSGKVTEPLLIPSRFVIP